MTYCARCIELEEELAAWRANDREAVADEADILRIDTARHAFQKLGCLHARGVARLLLYMATRPGRLCLNATLYDVLASRGAVDGQIVKVRVSAARKSLTLAGLPDAIRTVWGEGYVLTAEHAPSVRAILNGSADPLLSPSRASMG